jgi:hypothetical protein
MANSALPVSRAEWAALAVILAVAAFLRLWQVDLGYLSLHTSRDLYRSLLLLRGVEFPLLGSEILYGGRVLGPLMYFLCAPPLAIWCSPLSVAYFIALVNLALVFVVWRFARSYFGPSVALWSAAIYAVFPLEISQLRFYWNPCFIPLMSTVALIAVLAVAVRGRVWHLVTAAIFIAFAIQLHMSGAELIIGAGLILLIARPRIPLPVWAAALAVFLLLFAPLIVHELTAQKSDIAQVVTSPDTHRGALERFHFNPNGIKSFLYHVRLQMNEDGSALGFVYLSTVPLIGDQWLEPWKMKLARAINAFGQIQLLLWGVGVLACLGAIWSHWRKKTREGDDDESRITDHDSRSRMISHSALLIWQAVPVLFLCFFNYHGFPGQPPSNAPIRYYLVSYPAPFITSGLGVVTLARWLASASVRAFERARVLPSPRNSVAGDGARGVRDDESRITPHASALVFGVVGLLLVSHVAFDLIYLQVLGRSGRSIPYQFPNLAPNMRTMLAVRDILLGDAKIDRDAWYERVHGQQLGEVYFGEATFDWLITQDPRSVTNPPPDPHLRWLLHSPFETADVHSPTPQLPPGAQEVRRWTVGQTGITIVEYRVADPGEPMPDNTLLRNFYFRDQRMLYLGPGAELRARVRAHP